MTREQAELQKKVLLALTGSEVLDIQDSGLLKVLADLQEADFLKVEYTHGGKISFALTCSGWCVVELLEVL